MKSAKLRLRIHELFFFFCCLAFGAWLTQSQKKGGKRIGRKGDWIVFPNSHLITVNFSFQPQKFAFDGRYPDVLRSWNETGNQRKKKNRENQHFSQPLLIAKWKWALKAIEDLLCANISPTSFGKLWDTKEYRTLKVLREKLFIRVHLAHQLQSKTKEKIQIKRYCGNNVRFSTHAH